MTIRRRSMLVGLVVFAATLLGAGTANAAWEADVQIYDVSHTPRPAVVGEPLTYNVLLRSIGTTATDVRLTAVLPSSFTFDPTTSDAGCTESEGTITCRRTTVNYDPWNPNGYTVVAIGAIPHQTGTFEASFSVQASEPDPDLSNNSATEVANVVTPSDADLSAHIGNDAMTAYAGETFYVPYSFENAGPATATNVALTFDVPHGVQATEIRPSCSLSGGDLVCPVGTMHAKTAGPGWQAFEASEAGSYTFGITITGDNDPIASNNSDTAVVEVLPAADVTTSITESADPVKSQRDVTYRVRVQNLGPSDATEVALDLTWATDTKTDVVRITSSQGTCTTGPASARCLLGSVADGGTADVSLTLRPKGSGSITVTASAASSVHDGTDTNNDATETTRVSRSGR